MIDIFDLIRLTPLVLSLSSNSHALTTTWHLHKKLLRLKESLLLQGSEAEAYMSPINVDAIHRQHSPRYRIRYHDCMGMLKVAEVRGHYLMNFHNASLIDFLIGYKSGLHAARLLNSAA